MRTLEVIPNPYIALDKDGVPQGVVSAGMPGLWIGAQVDLVASNETGKARFYYPPNRDGSFTRKVKMTSDIVTSILEGELIVCGAENAAACGINAKNYKEPEKALAEEKAKALAYLESVKGEGAKLGDIPRKATAAKEGETAPVEKATKQLTPTVKLKTEG